MSGEPDSKQITAAIMIGVLVWGLVIALGVLLFRRSWPGFFIVAGCTVAFVGIWKLLLNVRPPKSPSGGEN